MNDELNYSRIIRVATETPWAILPQKLAIIQEIIILRSQGIKFSDDEIRQRIQAEQGQPRQSEPRQPGQSNIAIIPLIGTIVPRTNFSDISSDAISVNQFRKNFRAALADDDIDGILIDVDSPGGQVGQIPEMADEIFTSRGQKPIIAVANNLAASAAYWLASAADELIVSPSGEVGSIGVFALHEDISRALAIKGVDITLVSAGKYKTEGNPFEALGQDARAAIQERVDDYYGMFIDAVARYRGTTVEQVKEGFGQGRVVGARDAIKLNMADQIGTLDDGVMAVAESSGIQASFVQHRIVQNKDTISIPVGTYTSTGVPSGLPVIVEEEDIVSKIKLEDGTELTVEQVQALYEDVQLSRLELQEERIKAIANEASDRGVAPYVTGIAVQVLGQLDMDAQRTISLDLGQEQGKVQVNMFGAIKEILATVPGRAGEITASEIGDKLPQERQNANPYRQQEATTTEEAEAWAVERRKKLGLVRNGNSTDEIELG